MSRRRATTTLLWSGCLAWIALAFAACVAPSTDEVPPAPATEGTQDAATTGDSQPAPAPEPPRVPTPNLPSPVQSAVNPHGAMSKPPDVADESPIHGTLTTRVVARQTEGFRDRDVYALVEAGIDDPDADAWNAYVSGRVSRDLDGKIHDGASPFHSLDDTHGGVMHGRLYEAWVELHTSALDEVRVGRQELWETPEWVRFDGLKVESQPEGGWKRQFGFYGGQPARLESSESGDSVWGAWLKLRPWSGGSTRLDAMNLEDEERLGADQDTLLSADVRQQLGRELAMQAAYTWLEGSPREFDLRANWMRAASGWVGQVRYHKLLNTQHVLAEEFDPFSTALFTYQPYWQAGAMLAKSFALGFDLQGGWDMRRLSDDDDEGEFNREYERGYLTGAVHDVLVDGCTVSLTGERWDAEGSEMDTWGVDLTQQVDKELSASVGSYYSVYKDDFLLGQEHQDVRTWYAKLKLRTDPTLTWTFAIDHEVNEIDTYDTVTVRAAWKF